MIDPAALAQQPGPSRDILDMIVGASPPTHVVLGVLGLFSVVSLWVIIAKVRHFRRVRAEGDRFGVASGFGGQLGEAFQAVQQLPESPYTRLFQGGPASSTTCVRARWAGSARRRGSRSRSLRRSAW